jgi:hypothetical protein
MREKKRPAATTLPRRRQVPWEGGNHPRAGRKSGAAIEHHDEAEMGDTDEIGGRPEFEKQVNAGHSAILAILPARFI